MKKKVKKYSLGGQLLSTGVSFIPGVGQILSPIISMIDQQRDQSKMEGDETSNQPIKINTNPFGKALGGPVDPPINFPKIQMEANTTFVAPRPFVSNTIPQPAQSSFEQDALRDVYKMKNTPGYTEIDLAPSDHSGSSKSKSMERFREKANGGFITDDFKQYNTGSHSSGMDQTIDEHGNPNNNSDVASVQNNENMFKVGGKPFIMSDTLRNPETGNTFNIDAKKINNRFKNSRFDITQKNSLEFEMGKLAMTNNILKDVMSKQKAQGGFTDPPKSIYDLGLTNNQNVDPADSVPPSDNLFLYSSPELNQNSFPELPKLELNPLERANPDISGSRVETPNPNKVLNSIQDRNADSGRHNSLSSSEIANGAALATKAYALGQSIYDAVSPAENEKLILPDYSKADNYMREANVDYSQARQDAVGASNITSNLNRSFSGSASQYQARQANRVGALQDVLSRISEAQGNAQSQISLTKGQYESNKALDTANRRYQNQQGNMQNQATSRYADRLLASNLSQIGTELNEYSVQQDEMKNRNEIARLNTQQAVQYMQSKYPNIVFTPENVEKFQKGEISLDQLIQVKI